MKKNRVVMLIVFLALYAIAGWNQRGWVDWLGLATVALLATPIMAFMPERRERHADTGEQRDRCDS